MASWLAFAAVLAGTLVLFFTINFGGGDSKMLAATALWVGWSELIPFLMYTVLAGGGLALLVIIWKRIGQEGDARGFAWLASIFNRNIRMPYGVAIAIGGIWVFSDTWWIKSIV